MSVIPIPIMRKVRETYLAAKFDGTNLAELTTWVEEASDGDFAIEVDRGVNTLVDNHPYRLQFVDILTAGDWVVMLSPIEFVVYTEERLLDTFAPAGATIKLPKEG